MSYQVLSRKWRPKVFADVIGQGHITRALINSLKDNRIGHAYLFNGTRGIGKTSIARIFSRALCCKNKDEFCNPCNTCESCKSALEDTSLDIIEIDGASNNGVENIRALIENIHYAPVHGLYRVYIIDEVHMLSMSAFNALLKTLEEPPAHVVFIMATTEVHKVPPTVLSRCQRLDFKNATIFEISEHLKNILIHENIEFSSESILKRLAGQGKGSVRDTLSLLDQVISYCGGSKIDEDVMTEALGLVKTQSTAKLLSNLFIGDDKSFTDLFFSLLEQGVPIANITQGLIDYYYFIIEKFDFKERLYEQGIVDKGCLDQIEYAELYWIYETMVKDFDWTLKAYDPESTTLVALKKLVLRKRFFQKKTQVSDNTEKVTHVTEDNSDPIREEALNLRESEQNQIEIVEEHISNNEAEQIFEEDGPQTQVVEELSQEHQLSHIETDATQNEELSEEQVLETNEKPQASEENKSWHGLLSFIETKSMALSSNLEQGNLIEELNLSQEYVSLRVGFTSSTQVFCEHLNNVDVKKRLQGIVAEYFDISADKIQLSLELLEKHDNFQSVADIKEEEEKKQEEKKINEFMQNEYIQQAQEVFNSKVDKVVLN